MQVADIGTGEGQLLLPARDVRVEAHEFPLHFVGPLVADERFRGLIANALWIRANDLQQDGKYFEMVQLADWITKLEPTLTQVWTVQGGKQTRIEMYADPDERWRRSGFSSRRIARQQRL